MQNLPIHQVLPRVTATLEASNHLVLEAQPGAGKTTVVPIALLDAPWLGDKQIIMLEPRRLTARNAASRMAELLGERVGETVGYQIRADRCVGEKSRIIVVTEGILTRMLQHDPALENVAMLIFDEFHERNLHADLALALALQSQELLRDDLKIMVMSATIDTQAIARLLYDAPVIASEGRSFPVENIYLDARTPHPSPMQLGGLIAKTVTEVIRNENGSILIFLPGVREIKNVEAKLRSVLDDDILVAPLYGDMGKQAQDAAIRPCTKGRRKVVLATNIAETSLTIEGVTVVIDAGLQRLSTFNSGSGMNRLHTVAISQDAAAQRSGRAGRLAPGKCYRLWHEHRPLARHSTPEIATSDLTPMMLELARWGVDDVEELQWLDLPAPDAVAHARKLLGDLGALEGNTITAHGTAMLELGTHPRLAHMILKAAELGYGSSAALVAALLSEKDIFLGSARHEADLSLRVTALLEQRSGTFISPEACKRVRTTASEFRRRLKAFPVTQNADTNNIGLLLAFAYPDRIAKRRDGKSGRYLLSSGKGAVLNTEDGLFGETFLVIAELDANLADARIFSAAAITEVELHTYFSSLITRDRQVEWNDETERVEARETTRLGSITLGEQPLQNVESADISAALLAAVRDRGLDVLCWSKEALALRQRIGFLNYWKERDPVIADNIGELPDFSDSWLLHHLERWLLPHLDGVKSFRACGKLDTYPMLLGMLSWEQQKRIDELAPLKLRVPSGSAIVLNYCNPASPLLSVRLQELFGMLETPSLLNGSATITVELLSPAHRPMQVTRDLHSFWENAYHEVKKELRGKYKKHYWPDDPFSAQATSKTKKHM